jgi:hypothetical protein
MDREYKVCSDMVTWLKLLSKGNLVYITDPLSSFRQHEDQGQKEQKNEIIGTIELAHQILNARELGFLKQDSDYSEAIEKCLGRFNSVYDKYKDIINADFKEFSVFHNQLLDINNQAI